MASSENGAGRYPEPLRHEPLSTLAEPLPLPPYEFDPAISEDENLLTWVSILARHSSSRKGHMGTIFVRPPEQGDPSQPPCTQCQPPIHERIVHYANNTPLLYSRLAKAVPEVHAEALAISRCARRGIAVEGSSVYISFPPCNDCFKLLLSAGITRCVFKKGIPIATPQGEGALVAAEVEGMQLVGTLDDVMRFKATHDDVAEADARSKDKKRDEERDLRVRRFWASVGEDAARTRARVSRWWDDYNKKYRAAEKRVYGRVGVPHSIDKQQAQEAGSAASLGGKAPMFDISGEGREKQTNDQSASHHSATDDVIRAANSAVQAAQEESDAGAGINNASAGRTSIDGDLDDLRNQQLLQSPSESAIPSKRPSEDTDVLHLSSRPR